MEDRVSVMIRASEGGSQKRNTYMSGDMAVCFVIKGAGALSEGRTDGAGMEFVAAWDKIPSVILPIVIEPMVCSIIEKNDDDRMGRAAAMAALAEALKKKSDGYIKDMTTRELKEGSLGLLETVKSIVKAMK